MVWMLQFAFSHFNFSISREISQFIASSSIYLFSFNPKSSLKFCNPKSIYLLNFLYSLFLFLYSLFFDFFFLICRRKKMFIYFFQICPRKDEEWVISGFARVNEGDWFMGWWCCNWKRIWEWVGLDGWWWFGGDAAAAMVMAGVWLDSAAANLSSSVSFLHCLLLFLFDFVFGQILCVFSSIWDLFSS
jgi:hypothetical protein